MAENEEDGHHDEGLEQGQRRVHRIAQGDNPDRSRHCECGNQEEENRAEVRDQEIHQLAPSPAASSPSAGAVSSFFIGEAGS
jgi:hypothetical protein